jgi:hypothetical protein
MRNQVATVACIVLIPLFAWFLRQEQQKNPLLGLWDTGHYENRALPPPTEVPPKPVEQVLTLAIDKDDITPTQQTLGDLFLHYGLDFSLLRPTIVQSGLGDPPADTPYGELARQRLKPGILTIPMKATARH